MEGLILKKNLIWEDSFEANSNIGASSQIPLENAGEFLMWKNLRSLLFLFLLAEFAQGESVMTATRQLLRLVLHKQPDMRLGKGYILNISNIHSLPPFRAYNL